MTREIKTWKPREEEIPGPSVDQYMTKVLVYQELSLILMYEHLIIIDEMLAAFGKEA